MRTSMYKDSILQALTQAHLLSISDIRKKVRRADFSTIFRNLEQLCTEGIVRKIYPRKDVVLYELVGHHDHGHFVCDGCGGIESIETSTVSRLPSRAVIRDIVVHGTCARCVV